MAVRGALDVAQTYNDTFVGWPLAPQAAPHGVYGTFLNPTMKWGPQMPGPDVDYHRAIDIAVNDALGPRPVLAIEGGTVIRAPRVVQTTPLGVRVQSGSVVVGRFLYGHVRPHVSVGDAVAPGDVLGETVPGWWHVHLEEYLAPGGKRNMLNPLRPGGKLGPLLDTMAPVISAIRIYPKADENRADARVLPREQVRGVVVPVALASDPFPLRDWPGAPTVPLHVYSASVRLAREDGPMLVDRELFRLDRAPGPIWQHFFRPLTRRSAPVAVCVERQPPDCASRLWLRLWERGWDTTTVANGWYLLTLTVGDVAGNHTSRSLRLRVAN